MKHAKNIFILYEMYRKCIQERTTTLHRIIFRIFIFVLVSFSCETSGVDIVVQNMGVRKHATLIIFYNLSSFRWTHPTY